MTEGNSEAQPELEDILRRLEDAHQRLTAAVERIEGDEFARERQGGESVKRLLERTADDINFYYGSLSARALNLPQPPCLQRAEFFSIREASMSLQVAHRRFTKLLHDLIPGDLERVANSPEHGSYTLRQVLELTAGFYREQERRIDVIAGESSPAKSSPV